jgi:hypothetical protein
MWTFLRGLKKDIAIQRLHFAQVAGENASAPKLKYKKLAERLRLKVEKYHEEEDKLKYLRSIAYMI